MQTLQQEMTAAHAEIVKELEQLAQLGIQAAARALKKPLTPTMKNMVDQVRRGELGVTECADLLMALA